MNVSSQDSALWAATLIHSRRTTLPKRLCDPGPDATQKALILEAAAAAPDHEQILPWRFVEVAEESRTALGQAFEDALMERDPQANADERLQARDKAMRSPWLLLAVARTGGPPQDIPASERLLSAGAAVQNMLLMATALGLGSSLTSGKAMASPALRTLFGLNDHEQALCFLNFGHIRDTRKERMRPAVERYFSRLRITPPGSQVKFVKISQN
ncbi:MAG: nitroreductase [Limnohabitans sp.]